MKSAAFPVIKTLAELDRSACSIPGPTLDYLASLEWITAAENLCPVGPPGTGKSHVLVSLGVTAVQAGHKVRYFTAARAACWRHDVIPGTQPTCGPPRVGFPSPMSPAPFPRAPGPCRPARKYTRHVPWPTGMNISKYVR